MKTFSRAAASSLLVLLFALGSAAEASCTRTRKVEHVIAEYYLYQPGGASINRTLKVKLNDELTVYAESTSRKDVNPCRHARINASKKAVDTYIDLFLQPNDEERYKLASKFQNYVWNAIKAHIKLQPTETIYIQTLKLRSYTGLVTPEDKESARFRFQYAAGNYHFAWVLD